MDEETKKQSSQIIPSPSSELSQGLRDLAKRGLELVDKLEEQIIDGSKAQPIAHNQITLNSNPIRVLIVDDVIETRKAIRELLQFEDDIKIVGEASNGREAIQQFEILMPDVMTTCINMPVMDGIASIREICRKYPRAKIIVLTVQGNESIIKRAMAAGARIYITKPPMPGEFISAIRHASGRKPHISDMEAKQKLYDWYQKGKEDGYKCLIVKREAYDFEDPNFGFYPIYENFLTKTIIDDNNDVFNLQQSIESQLPRLKKRNTIRSL
jgi:two-component system, chemotaxis family, chemotaxis protein CheY